MDVVSCHEDALARLRAGERVSISDYAEAVGDAAWQLSDVLRAEAGLHAALGDEDVHAETHPFAFGHWRAMHDAGSWAGGRAHDVEHGSTKGVLLLGSAEDGAATVERRTTVEHPHVAPVLDSGERGGCAFAVVARLGPPPDAIVLTHVAHLAAGLSALHAAELVHGAIGDDAIGIDADGSVRLQETSRRRARAATPGADARELVALVRQTLVLTGSFPGRELAATLRCTGPDTCPTVEEIATALAARSEAGAWGALGRLFKRARR